MISFSLLFFTIITLASCLQLEPTYRSTPKRVIFGEFVPGSSHVNWVLPWLDELVIRGHQVTFITLDSNVKFATPYPRIKTLSVSLKNIDMPSFFKDLGSHPDPTKILPKIFELVGPNWRPSFDYMSKYIEENGADVLICDHMSDPCIDIALVHHLPLIITSTLSVFPDAKTGYINNDPLTMTEFTTLHQSFSRRFYNKYILPLTVFPQLKPQLNRIAQLKRDAGFIHQPPHHQRTENALKIVSSLYGLDPARPMGPLVELIGPVLSPHYPDLDLPCQTFLNTHHRVVYVAFGQHAKPDRHDIVLLLTALIQQVEKGYLDGILWSSRYPETFPATLASPFSGQVYNLKEILKKGKPNSPLVLVPWSPQLAVLLHPSVTVFLSHGGSNSLVESLYAGKRLLFYPFFGDQSGTAKQITQMGLAETFGPDTPQAIVDERVESVVRDRNRTYQAQVDRFQAMIQIHSQTAPRRAADLVEEMAFSVDRNVLLHRQDVGRKMSWIKRNNVDIHGVAVLGTVGLLGLVYRGVCIGYRAWISRRLKQKTL